MFQLASGRYKSRILIDIEQPVERNCLIQHVSRDDIRISRWILLARSPKGASVTAVPCVSTGIMKVRELEVGIGWHLKAFWPFLCTIFEKKTDYIITFLGLTWNLGQGPTIVTQDFSFNSLRINLLLLMHLILQPLCKMGDNI